MIYARDSYNFMIPQTIIMQVNLYGIIMFPLLFLIRCYFVYLLFVSLNLT